MKKRLLILLLFSCALRGLAPNVFAQAPVITYSTPKVYSVGTAITPLAPTNTGGAVGSYGTPAGFASVSNSNGVAVDPATGYVYATSSNNNTATIFNSAGTTLFTQTGSPYNYNAPSGIAVDAAGSTYVANRNAGTVVKTTTANVVTTITGFVEPTSVAVDASGTIYVIDRNSSVTNGGKLYKLSPGSTTAGTAYISGLNTPWGVAVNTAGDIYISVPGPGNSVNNILKAVAGSSATTVFVASGAGLSSPRNMVIDALGNIYESEAGINTPDRAINKISPAGVITRLFATPSDSPTAVAADASGNLYFSGYNFGGIFKSTAAGYTISATLPAGLYFNNYTGCISGTPTATSPATNYTITATNANGSSSFVVNITVNANGSVLDWKGTTSTNWNTASNWLPAQVPNTTNAVQIGVVGFTNQPNLSGTAGTAASITFGTAIGTTSYTLALTGATYYNPQLTISTNLTVTGGISMQSFSGSTSQVTELLVTNSSVISAASLTVGTAGFTTPFSDNGGLYVKLGTGSIVLSGDITLNGSPNTGTNTYGPGAMFFESGSVTCSRIVTSNSNSSSKSSFFLDLSIFGIPGTSTLNLTGAVPFVVSGTGANLFVLGNTSASNITVNYASTSPQTVFVNLPGLAGATTSTDYSNIIFSGNAAKTVNTAGGTIEASGSFSITGTTTANLSVNNPAVLIAGAFTNSGTYTGGTGTADFNGSSFTNSGSMNLAAGGTNIVASSFINSGTFTSGTGVVNFDGAAQTITSAAPITFNNVTFSNSGTKTLTGSGFAVSSTGLLTMAGTAILSVSNNLTLRSTAAGSASVGIITSPSAINGNVNVERYMAGTSLSRRGYRLLSSPVTQTTIGGQPAYGFKDLQATSPVTGYGATGAYTLAQPANAFDPSPAGNPSLFFYHEPDPDPASKVIIRSDYKGLNSIADVFPRGNGFLYFFRGNRNTMDFLGSSIKLSTAAVPENTTLNFYGALNQGTVNVYIPTNPVQTVNGVVVYATTPAAATVSNTLTYTANAGTNNGLHLVGNPFASAIDLEGITLNSPGSASLYMLNNAGIISAYVKGSNSTALVNGVGRYLLSGQGFFVTAIAGNTTTLSFPESCKVSTVAAPSVPTSFSIAKQNILAATKTTLESIQKTAIDAVNIPQGLLIKLSLDSVNYNETQILFNNKANKYSPYEDAYYMNGLTQTTFLASYSTDGKPCIINQMGGLDSVKTIPLYAEGLTSGIYKLNFSGAPALDPRYKLMLIDHFMKDSLDLSANTEYNFNIDRGNAKTYGASRFELAVRATGIAKYYHLSDFKGEKQSGGVMLTWKTQYEGDYTGFKIQRSTDGGKTFADVSNFQSNGTGVYSYLDAGPLVAGYAQYRLVQNNINNVNLLSNIVTIGYQPIADQITRFEVFPNPVATDLQVSVKTESKSNPLSVRIYNMAGILMMSSKMSTTGIMTQNVSKLQTGTYVIHVTDNANKEYGTTTFIKQ